MTDWFSLYKTYESTSNEQHLSNPTYNTQTENKTSQNPLMSNTFAVPTGPTYQYTSFYCEQESNTSLFIASMISPKVLHMLKKSGARDVH